MLKSYTARPEDLVCRMLFLVPLFTSFSGLTALYNVSTRPSFQAYRSLDVVGLVAAGMCFGAAIAMTVFFVRGDRRN